MMPRNLIRRQKNSFRRPNNTFYIPGFIDLGAQISLKTVTFDKKIYCDTSGCWVRKSPQKRFPGCRNQLCIMEPQFGQYRHKPHKAKNIFITNLWPFKLGLYIHTDCYKLSPIFLPSFNFVCFFGKKLTSFQ